MNKTTSVRFSFARAAIGVGVGAALWPSLGAAIGIPVGVGLAVVFGLTGKRS